MVVVVGVAVVLPQPPPPPPLLHILYLMFLTLCFSHLNIQCS
jgi:hypothetical protein